MRHSFESRLTRGPAPLSTIEVLERTPELRHIPVLAYSAPARVVSEARALLSGADRFLGDPAHLSRVFDIVASMHTPGARAAEMAGR